MKKLHQNVKKVIYFNDECFGLCKNFNNFSSLCLNENGSGLATTWNVFTVCKKKSFDYIKQTAKFFITI